MIILFAFWGCSDESSSQTENSKNMQVHGGEKIKRIKLDCPSFIARPTVCFREEIPEWSTFIVEQYENGKIVKTTKQALGETRKSGAWYYGIYQDTIMSNRVYFIRLMDGNDTLLCGKLSNAIFGVEGVYHGHICSLRSYSINDSTINKETANIFEILDSRR
ncbi:MAG: hypothetical protein A3D31_01080 [Candidatus Fluviicola riflensis]|nr:MAG: hypothetical protein CHH17_04460 [Candidatus Fluviicola riflensis]OGS76199.1 MAG: hypothetical protein A3D31_01080 [Candidatus Fluviicola riflensis]OGS83731.1 MAG: hypothetical protein A3E30_17685 [Fluviicola sp. RIFCSPHIGHO2_12_FULL_43_24]